MCVLVACTCGPPATVRHSCLWFHEAKDLFAVPADFTKQPAAGSSGLLLCMRQHEEAQQCGVEV